MEMRKSTLIFSVLVIVAFVAGSFAGYSVNFGRIRDLEEQIIRKDEQISALSEEVYLLQDWLNGNITYYEEQIATLNDQISILEEQKILGVYFSPKGGCEDQIINWINLANSSIHILIYSFTLDSVSDALIEAYHRGVEVKVVFEKSQIGQYSEYWKLHQAGIEVRNDTNSRLMHDKVMIVDGVIVLTGSFNWSWAAENSNNENLIVIRSTYIASLYEEEFEKIWSQSV